MRALIAAACRIRIRWLMTARAAASYGDLARRAFVAPQTMNQVLRELEERHWVTRHPHPGHGRILQAALTHSGRQTLQACHHAAGAVEKRMLAGLSPARREQLATALHACIEALSQWPPAGSGPHTPGAAAASTGSPDDRMKSLLAS
jgi:DNA-binding MarR family transcriptional regulator